MIYLLYGKEEYLINEYIKDIITKYKVDKININNYNLEEVLIEKIIDDANTYSLFNDKKIILVNNSYIITSSTRKKELEHNIDKLINYIDSPNEDTILIFISNEEKIDNKKKIVKKLNEKNSVIEFNYFNNINEFVKKEFNDYDIENIVINKLISRVGNDISLLKNEIEKLKLYKIEEKKILLEDVINLTNKNIETDIFKFIDNIILKEKEKAIETYNELIKNGEEPIKIIIMIANKIRIMYQAKRLYQKGYKENDVVSMIGAHPYAIKKTLENGRNYNEKTLLNHLEKLADLDENIKKGNIDPNLAVELFILNI